MAADLDAGFERLAEGLQALGRLPAVEPPSITSILVVDDRAIYRDSLVRLLELSGDFVVRAADGGAGALAEIERACPDIVLLDLIMPDMTGHEVIERITARGYDTRVIVVSGEPSFEHVQRAPTRGALDFIRKPYEPDELLSTIARVRDRIRLERRNRTMETHLAHSHSCIDLSSTHRPI